MSQTWQKINQFSKLHALQHMKTNFPKTTNSINTSDWGYKWSHTEKLSIHHTLQSKIGELIWISGRTRPDINFGVFHLASNLKNAKLADIKHLNILSHISSITIKYLINVSVCWWNFKIKTSYLYSHSLCKSSKRCQLRKLFNFFSCGKLVNVFC